MEAGGRENSLGADRKSRSRGEDKAQVSFLDQALWKRLSEADSLRGIAVAWLPLQCRMVPGALRGVVVLSESDKFVPAAIWPEGEGPTAILSAAIELTISEKRGVVRGGGTDVGEPNETGTSGIAYPVLVEDILRGVVAIEIDSENRAEVRAAMRQLQWGAAWIRDHARHEMAHVKDHVLERTRIALDMVGAALEQDGFAASCRAVATELAIQCDCNRVSVGFLKRGSTVVRAISHSAQFGKKMNLSLMLGAAMDEAIDQRSLILFPRPEADGVLATRAHGELSRAHGADHIFTVPFFINDRFVGAIVFERPADKPFDQESVDLLEQVAAVLGPILEEKRHNDRWIFTKLWGSIVEQGKRLLGPGYFMRKLVAMSAVAVVAFFYFATTDYRVTADASIQGTVQRAIVAPYDGFIRRAHARAGDTVEMGGILAVLDDRDLALERLRWVTERQKRRYEHDRAVAARDRAEIKIVKAQIKQAEAQIGLIDQQLARAKLTAPFTGLVVSGDLSQSIGAAVSRGDVLFEIAPLDSYRVVLRVDESQIADVEAGKQGDLLVSSLPHETFPFVVEKITPVAQASDGRNTFRVEAKLSSLSSRLRPGMEGVGKINVDQRRLIWIWSRPMLDWMRIFVWRWMP